MITAALVYDHIESRAARNLSLHRAPVIQRIRADVLCDGASGSHSNFWQCVMSPYLTGPKPGKTIVGIFTGIAITMNAASVRSERETFTAVL
jgi:hypothetical protein